MSRSKQFPSSARNICSIYIFFEKKNPLYNIIIGFLLVGFIFILNFILGCQIYFFLLYVIPISFLAWFVGRRVGIFSSLISFTAWFFLDISLVIHFLNPFIIASNSLIIITIFILITILVSSFRISLDHEKKLARTDSLTGAANSRLFSELLQMEVERLERYKHPFTLVYIDTDNLKFVNDNYGHTIGNQVLINIVDFAKNNLRKVDVISRLGGDEFALLLPETSYESSKIVISRFQKGLLSEMRKKNWPITLSIGAVTCNNANITADELLRIADKLMYEIKREGKNSIKQCNSD